MKVEWLKVAGGLLELAFEEFSNHGCNDWMWPKDWTKEQRRDFMEKLIAWNDNCTVESFDEEQLYRVEVETQSDYGPPDWLVMRFLACELIKGE